MTPTAPRARSGLVALAVAAFSVAALAVDTAAQAAATRAGRIKLATGVTAIVRGGSTVAATSGSEVFESDILRTGGDGRLAVMLADESRLSLGPNSELALSRFVYRPESQQLGLAVRLARGVCSYVSGLIARLAPESVRLQTPTSVIGVRGTHVLLKADQP